MNEFEAMKAIDEALAGLDSEARTRVMTWLNQKFPTASGSQVPPYSSNSESSSRKRKSKKTGKKSAGSSKKPKSVLKIDKEIDLFPKDAPTAPDFAKEKSPTNAKQKGTLAVYYIREKLGYESVKLSQVGAFFKAVGWPMPSDLSNTLQQAGTEGWLDTSDSDDIKITSQGENLVEFKLPIGKSA